jgi:hypothetical protein
MNKLLLLSVFVILSTNLFAQNCNTAFESTDFNVLYVGIPNHLKIVHHKVPSKKLVVTISNGEIKKLDDCNYEVIVKTFGTTKITVATKKGKILSEKEYRCKLIPMPIAVVNGKVGGVLTYEELMKAKTVDLDFQNFPYDLNIKIVVFTVSVTVKGFVEEISTKGNQISSQQKNLIQKLNESEGDKVYFEDIKAQMPDGSIIKLNNIAFKIMNQNKDLQNQIDEIKQD